MSVNDASALEDTLARLRQRYTLYFNLPEGVQPGQERNIVVDLTPDARHRYFDAEVRYRRTSMSGNGDRDIAPLKVTRAPASNGYSTPSASATNPDAPAVPHRRVAVNEDGSVIAAPPTDDTPAQPPPQSPPSHP